MKKEADPKMHTAEHILNQTMVRLFNSGRCFSAHIEKKKSKCDYHFTRALTSDEIKNIEEKINEIIKKDLLVNEEFLNKKEAQIAYNLKRLPDDVNEVRIVKIGDYDACPCIGEHSKNTSSLGSFKIISTDFNDGVLRIRYKLT